MDPKEETKKVEEEKVPVIEEGAENTEEVSPQAEFDTAWEEAPSEAGEEVTDVEVKDGEEGEEGEGADAPKGEIAPEKVKEDPPATPTPTSTPAPTSAQTAPPATDVVKKEQARKTLEGRIKAQERGTAKMKADYQSAYGPLTPIQTPEQVEQAQVRKAQVKEVEEKLPEVATAIDAKVNEAVKTVRDETEAGLLATKEKLEDQLHFLTISREHPDYEKYTIAGPEQTALLKWIQSQTYEVGEALLQVYKHGYPNEVNLLLSTFKSSLEGEANGNQSKTKGEVDPRVAAAEAVPGGGSPDTPKGNRLPDKDDYDGAWDYDPPKAKTASPNR